MKSPWIESPTSAALGTSTPTPKPSMISPRSIAWEASSTKPVPPPESLPSMITRTRALLPSIAGRRVRHRGDLGRRRSGGDLVRIAYGTPTFASVNPSMSTGVVIVGSGPSGVIVQVWVSGSKPVTGVSRSGAVDAGISKTMLLGPGVAWLESTIAARSESGIRD